jgi:UDP-N-acetylglucosamine 2-epimerase (hydrolysing)
MKNILFLTGTRADFGKLKSLMLATQNSKKFEATIFATGMHLIEKYGKTIDEIYKSGLHNIFPYINHDRIEYMDRTLANTIDGLSHFIAQNKPDLIVVHGDRVEALAGAIVGSLNNILVAHVEGGEVSGTIDELIRHSISKMAHIHLVSNNQAARRLLQMGELRSSIHVIGSPDLDIMLSGDLKSIDYVKEYYEIKFDKYALLLFHPVTTELDNWKIYTDEVVRAVIDSNKNYVVVFPNNDIGSDVIMDAYNQFNNKFNFRVFPSIRLEYFLVLLKHADFIIGNSSAGIREAPYYGVPTIDIGSRQNNRAVFQTIINCDYSKEDILKAISTVIPGIVAGDSYFGGGNSHQKFIDLIEGKQFWKVNRQKQFQERFF